MFVFREEYYLAKAIGQEATPEDMEKLDRVRNRAEVIIAKQRHGPTGTAHLHFQGEFTRFSDLADPDRFPEPHD